MYDRIQKNKLKVKSGKLLSTFIVDENGRPDSLKIIQGINPNFDTEYIKAFNSAKKMWKPALHQGKAVKVMMKQELKYGTMETMPEIFSSQEALAAYRNKDYELALYHYDKALELVDDNVDNLYRRGICKQMLGDLKEACSDWKKIQLMGNKTADEL